MHTPIHAYSVPASDRTDLVPAYSRNREPLYESQLGHALGDIVVGLQPKTREPEIITRAVNQTLTFVSTASKNLTVTKTVNQTLTFTDELILGKILERTVEQTLVFQQILGKIFEETVNDTLTFSQQLDREVTFNRTVSQNLIFNQTPTRNITSNKSVSQTINFSQTVIKQKVAERTVNDVLTFTQVLKRVKDVAVNQTLTFVDAATQNRDRDVYVSDKLIFNQIVTKNMSFYREVQQQLVFKQPQVYSPINGEPITLPNATYTLFNVDNAFVILESITDLVILPNPEWGDTDKPEHEIRVARSMNNTVYSFIKKNLLRTLKYEFELGRLKALELQQFCNKNAGKPIYLKNWKGEIWYGNIVNDPIQYTPVSRYAPTREKVQVALEFSGMKL